MSDQKYFKTTAVARAFVREPSWKPASAKAMLEALKAPEDMLTRASSEEFDPLKDLLKVDSILVSTGMNKNTDVFLPDELAKVRASGAHKPFNLEHDITKVVGHMTRTFLLTKEGDELSDEQIEKSGFPADFDIGNEAVVYAFALPKVAENVRKLAAAGELFVSVEMWFTDYDFLVGNKVIARNEQTAFLDQCLRANGGDGVFKGEVVGRVLRNMLIGGIGFVEKPANPESVIKSISSLRSEGVRDVDIYSEPSIETNVIEDFGRKSLSTKNKEEDDMSTKLLEEIAETVKVEAKAAAEKAVEEIKKDQTVESTQASESKDDTDGEVSHDVKALMATVANLTDTVEKQSQTIAAMQQEKRVSDRRSALAGLGLEGDELQKAIELGADMNESNFKSFCDLFADAFNEKNLRTEASEGNQNEDKEDETTEDSTEAAEDKTAEDQADASDSDDEDGEDTDSTDASEDTLIDLDKIEDVDADVGAGEGKTEASSVEDRMEKAISSRLCARNKHWRRAAAKAKKDDE